MRKRTPTTQPSTTGAQRHGMPCLVRLVWVDVPARALAPFIALPSPSAESAQAMWKRVS